MLSDRCELGRGFLLFFRGRGFQCLGIQHLWTPFLKHGRREFLADLRILPQELNCRLLAVAKSLVLIAEMRAALLDEFIFQRELQEVAIIVDPAIVQNLELGITEWRSDLVLDHALARLGNRRRRP